MGFEVLGNQGILSQLAAGWGWYALVLFIGAAAGAIELVGRYKDSPFTILLSKAALLYIFVNAGVSLVAYGLIVAFDWKFTMTDADAHKDLVRALVAGFGAMVFFRSSLFSVRVGQTDVMVGPALLFQVLLFATDRECDRNRARPRSDLVAAIMRGIDFEKARAALPPYCYELMQNVPPNEQNQLTLVVEALATRPGRNDIKSEILGLMLMNMVGADVLRVAVDALRARIQTPATLTNVAVVGRLQMSDFSKAASALTNACLVIAPSGTDAEREKRRAYLMAEIQTATKDPALDNGAKMAVLGLLFQRHVGEDVLEAALTLVGPAISLLQPAKPLETEVAKEAAAKEAEAMEACAKEAAVKEAAAKDAGDKEAAAMDEAAKAAETTSTEPKPVPPGTGNGAAPPPPGSP